MELCERERPGRLRPIVIVACVVLSAACSVSATGPARRGSPQVTQSAATRPVGTIKSITGKTIILTTDAGTEVRIEVQDDARLVRIEPGQKDLKNAAPMQLQELQPGDRILVRGALGPDGKTLLAASVIAMKQADIATKQAHEREEWQKHGVGGLVTNIDAPNAAITISTNATGAAKDVKVQVSKQTVLRRYAPNSVKFDDAKPAPIEEIKVGDQLRARGTRNADGRELTADEVVSGSFRNIAGTINAIDAAAGRVTVMDLVTKQAVTVKIGAEAQLRKLPPMMARMIAIQLKGGSADTPAAGTAPTNQAQRPTETTTGGQAGGAARPGGGRSGDMQQMLSRMPATTLAELQKGDAVMIVATESTHDNEVTAITLLTGVEPLLQASPAGGGSGVPTLWNLSGPPSGDTTP